MKPPAYIVTGATNGIGQAIAKGLLARGHTVVNIDRAVPSSTTTNLINVQADLTSAAETKDAAAHVVDKYSVVGLVNNAGATKPGTIDSPTLLEDLDFVVDLQLRAPLILTRAVLPSMREAGWGRIVNMSSRAALGKENRVVYSATKAGLLGLTRTLALELGADGITVNALGPGPIATELFMKSNPPDKPQTKKIMDSILVKRFGTPEDVARAAMFFLDKENGFVTGQVMYVCGGLTVGLAP